MRTPLARSFSSAADACRSAALAGLGGLDELDSAVAVVVCAAASLGGWAGERELLRHSHGVWCGGHQTRWRLFFSLTMPSSRLMAYAGQRLLSLRCPGWPQPVHVAAARRYGMALCCGEQQQARQRTRGALLLVLRRRRRCCALAARQVG